MRRILLGCVAGLMVCGAAWAEGPIVRWDQIIGVTGHESEAQLVVDGIVPSGRWITVRDGRAMLDLATGFVTIKVEGVSYARHYGFGSVAPAPLGGPIPASNSRYGTFVCGATSAYPVQVDTETFFIERGAGSYRGFLTGVPEECRQHPEDIVFLLRTVAQGGTLGPYFAYGAAQTIQ